MEAESTARLVDALSSYCALWPEEAPVVDRIISFLRSHPEPFSRSCLEGHITGSAFVVDPGLEKTLFVHHAKLDKWLQPGGHCEEGEGALEASRREAAEETGVELGRPVDSLPLDVDIHEIPARDAVPAHLHLDIRYLFVSPLGETRSSEESHAVEWLSFAEARSRNPEASISRPLAKIEELGPVLKAKLAKKQARAASDTRGGKIGASPEDSAMAPQPTGSQAPLPDSKPSRDPLHGKTLEMILNELVARHGWEGLAELIPIRCFTHDPSLKSSLVFLRRTPWARAKVETLYLGNLGRRRGPSAKWKR
ncbi:MAG TPA: VF530 family DNA-binding protein [Rectinemataceae bacterium]|nr:VF530 family DNA-binding protein [Rectinemataceae bacterium]